MISTPVTTAAAAAPPRCPPHAQRRCPSARCIAAGRLQRTYATSCGAASATTRPGSHDPMHRRGRDCTLHRRRATHQLCGSVAHPSAVITAQSPRALHSGDACSGSTAALRPSAARIPASRYLSTTSARRATRRTPGPSLTRAPSTTAIPARYRARQLTRHHANPASRLKRKSRHGQRLQAVLTQVSALPRQTGDGPAPPARTSSTLKLKRTPARGHPSAWTPPLARCSKAGPPTGRQGRRPRLLT